MSIRMSHLYSCFIIHECHASHSLNFVIIGDGWGWTLGSFVNINFIVGDIGGIFLVYNQLANWNFRVVTCICSFAWNIFTFFVWLLLICCTYPYWTKSWRAPNINCIGATSIFNSRFIAYYFFNVYYLLYAIQLMLLMNNWWQKSL